MLKRFIRWMLPLMVLALIAMYIVMSPMVSIHAAGPMAATHITISHGQKPKMRWRP
jgi:hypothetical protein